jgi:SOS response regulatory protein OraA/RecX
MQNPKSIISAADRQRAEAVLRKKLGSSYVYLKKEEKEEMIRYLLQRSRL